MNLVFNKNLDEVPTAIVKNINLKHRKVLQTNLTVIQINDRYIIKKCQNIIGIDY